MDFRGDKGVELLLEFLTGVAEEDLRGAGEVGLAAEDLRGAGEVGLAAEDLRGAGDVGLVAEEDLRLGDRGASTLDDLRPGVAEEALRPRLGVGDGGTTTWLLVRLVSLMLPDLGTVLALLALRFMLWFMSKSRQRRDLEPSQVQGKL